MLSKFSVKKPYTIVVAVVLVLILGAVSFLNMSTDLLPSMNIPYVVVYTTYPGASPEEIEQTVTKPIEQTVAATSNLKEMISTSSENMSMVMLEFYESSNMDSIMLELNEKLSLIDSTFPEGAGTPSMIKMNPTMLPVMMVAVDKEGMDTAAISQLVNDELMTELEKTGGIASVSGSGLVTETVKVDIRQEKIDQVNRKILAAVDAELAETADELDEAEDELASGKSKLSSEKKKQTAKLQTAQKAVDDGLKQISGGKEQLTSGLSEIKKQRTELEKQIGTLEEQEKSLQSQITGLKNLGSAITEEQKLTLAGLEAGLEQTQAGLKQARAGLKTIREKQSEAEGSLAELEAQEKELTSQKKELADGKAQLQSGMRSAQSKLDSAQKELDAQREKFEEARDKALEDASIDGVITVEMIQGILSAENFSMPAGYITEDGRDYLVKVGDEISGTEELERLMLFDMDLDGVDRIYLADVADIRMEDDAEELYAKLNGSDAVLLSFQKQNEFSTADVCKSIRQRMDELEAKYDGLRFTILMDQGVYIDIVVGSVLENLLYGGGLAILVLLLFLRSLRPTVVVAVSIPISVVFAIAMMYFSGVTLNMISLAGLALGVGMLVDNSIVVIENIYRMRSLGMSAKEASVQGAKQVAGAIAASTLTTVCVFLPIIFVEGMTRELFTDMGLTIAYSLLASLIVALTLVPVMTSRTLRRHQAKPGKERLQKAYGRVLAWSLRHKWITILLAVGLLAYSGYSALQMGLVFMPDSAGTQLSITLKMPDDALVEQTRTMSDEASSRILEIEGVDAVGAMMGGGLMSTGSEQSCSLYVILKEEYSRKNQDIAREIKERTADMDCEISVSTSNMDMSAMTGSGVSIEIRGSDLDMLRQIAGEMAELLRSTEGTQEIDDGSQRAEKELRVTVNKEAAMERGLTVAQVYSAISDYLSEGKDATTVSMSGSDYKVRVSDGRNEIDMREALSALIIPYTKDGEEKKIALSRIASIAEAEGLDAIQRNNQQRYMTVSAEIQADYNVGLVSRDVEQKLAAYTPPEGYTVAMTGESETINSTMQDLILMVLLAIVFVYLIMVAQFQSLLSPFIVLFTIPLAFTGGILALLITGMELSMISMLGFLVLAGIIVNNGIVFVDYTNKLMESGMEKRAAIVEAGRTRMRPILMTAITTILGLATLAFGVGQGAEMLQPLAVVTVGGLIYATLLTLFVVPALYDLFRRKKRMRPEPITDEHMELERENDEG